MPPPIVPQSLKAKSTWRRRMSKATSIDNRKKRGTTALRRVLKRTSRIGVLASTSQKSFDAYTQARASANRAQLCLMHKATGSQELWALTTTAVWDGTTINRGKMGFVKALPYGPRLENNCTDSRSFKTCTARMPRERVMHKSNKNRRAGVLG